MGKEAFITLFVLCIGFGFAEADLQTCNKVYDCFEMKETPFCCAVNETYNVCGTCHGKCQGPYDCLNNNYQCCKNPTENEGYCYPSSSSCPIPVPPEPWYIPDPTTTKSSSTSTTTTTTTTTTHRAPQCYNLEGCCSIQAQVGQCNTNPGPMRAYCPAACGFCTCDDPSRCRGIPTPILCNGPYNRCMNLFDPQTCERMRANGGCYTDYGIANCYQTCIQCRPN